MNTEKLTWYVARSGGIVAWLLLAFGLILGLLLSSRILGRRASPAWILSIHRFLGGLSVIFTAVHVAAIMLDDFVSFGWADVLVPWHSEWNPGAVAWGIIAMYLMIAIELTSFAMRRLPKGLWRAVHWSSAPLFVMATVHGYQAGTDAGRAFMIAIIATMAILVVLTAIRIVQARRTTEAKLDPRQLVEEARIRKQQRLGRLPEPVPASGETTSSWLDAPGEPVAVPEPAGAPGLPDPEPQRDPVATWSPRSEAGASTSWMLDTTPLAPGGAQPSVEPEPGPAIAPSERTRSWFSEDEPASPSDAPAFGGDAAAFPDPAALADEPAFGAANPEQDTDVSVPDQADEAAFPAPDLEPEPAFGAEPARSAPQPEGAGVGTPVARAPAFADLPEADDRAATAPDHEPAIDASAVDTPAFPRLEQREPATDPAAFPEDPPAPAPSWTPEPEPPSAMPDLAPSPPPAVSLEPGPEPAQRDEPWWSPPEVEDQPVLVGATADAARGDGAAFPRPAWSDDGPLAWVTAEAAGNPEIRRREGPVPGVWKRSKRDVASYTAPDRDG